MNLSQNLPRFGFYLFLAALGLAPLLGGTPIGPEYAMAAWGGDGMLGVLRFLIVFAALLVAVGTPKTLERSVVSRIAHIALYATGSWVALSTLIHSHFLTVPVYMFAMVPEVLNWLTFVLAFALASRFATEDRKNLPKMAAALLVGGAICAIIGIMAFGQIPGAERITHRESATFFSPNFAAGFAALTIPLAAALFLTAESLLPLAAFGASGGLLFALLMITGSRAGLALTLIGLVVALVLAIARRFPLHWGKVGALVAILALFGILFRAPMLGRVAAPTGTTASVTAADAASGGDHSGEFRKETWKGSLKMTKANAAFGAGPGTFPYTYSRYATVGWTAQAHSSYLQVSSEEGIPALLLLLLGIGASLLAGIQFLFTKTEHANKDNIDITGILIPALIGGVMAALGRSVFDSEWMLLGCGIPFFAAIGILTANPTAPEEATEPTKSSPLRIAQIAVLIAGLILTIYIRNNQSQRDGLALESRTNPDTATKAGEAASHTFPGDPQLYSLANDYKTAAYLSPSGKRLFQLARYYERQGNEAGAVAAFKDSVAADPNNLQTRKALAEAQEKAGDKAGALFTYTDMVDIAKGPAGKIRAIPELPDTLPAFAYTALAEDDLLRGDANGANEQFAIAQSIIEEYAHTPKVYQISEALTLGQNTAARRAEVRALYTDRILKGRRAALKRLNKTTELSALDQAESQTTALLDAFLDPTAGVQSGS